MAGEYSPLVYMEVGGDRQVVASGGSFDVESGGEIDIESGGSLKLAGTALTSTAAELNALDGAATTFTFEADAAAANVCEVTVTAKDAAGATVAAPLNFDLWLSDAATGAGLTGTAASGTVTVKSASGAVIGTYEAKKALRVQSQATGVFILEITDTAKTTFYPVAQVPATGKLSIGTILATGDYG